MSYEITPLEVCKRLFGSLEHVAKVIGYVESAPYNWQRPSKHRAAGDLPSSIIQRKLLKHAHVHNIPLTATHLIFGADSAEIEALLASMAASQVAAE